MNKGKSAISVLLLSIYTLVLCHASIPHFHYDTSEIVLIEHEGHSHHHGHKHSSNSDESWIDYLTGLLNDLGHKEQGENHLDELVFEINSHKSDVIKHNSKVSNSEHYISIETEIISIEEYVEIYIRPPILYEQLCSNTTPLRGPPTI